MYVCMYVCKQVSKYVYIYNVYIYIYMLIHTHTHSCIHLYTYVYVFSFELAYDSWHDPGVLSLILLAPVLHTCRSRTLKCNRID